VFKKFYLKKKAKWIPCDLGQYSRPTVSSEVERVHVQQVLDNARRFFEEGRLKPVITKTWKFAEIETAFAELQAGKSTNGKAIVEIVSES